MAMLKTLLARTGRCVRALPVEADPDALKPHEVCTDPHEAGPLGGNRVARTSASGRALEVSGADGVNLTP